MGNHKPCQPPQETDLLLIKTVSWFCIHDAYAANVNASFRGQRGTSIEPEVWFVLDKRQMGKAIILGQVLDLEKRVRIRRRRKSDSHLDFHEQGYSRKHDMS